MNLNSIKEYVREKKIKAEFIEHKKVNGIKSSSAVIATGYPIDKIVKVLLIKGSQNKYAICILSGNRRIRWEAIKDMNSPKLASEEDIARLLDATKGGIAPIGLPDELIKYVDKPVLENDFVVGSAGTPYVGLKISPSEIVKQSNTIVTSIS